MRSPAWVPTAPRQCSRKPVGHVPGPPPSASVFLGPVAPPGGYQPAAAMPPCSWRSSRSVAPAKAQVAANAGHDGPASLVTISIPTSDLRTTTHDLGLVANLRH